MLLVLHHGAIGDFMLTLSVVGALREHLGKPPVEVIASAPSARWAARQGLIEACRSPESVGLHTLFAADTPLDDRLADLLRRATTVASFLGGDSEAAHLRLQAAGTGRVISVDPRPNATTINEGIHITEQWATDIRKQGLAIGPPLAIQSRGSGAFATFARKPIASTSTDSANKTVPGGLPTFLRKVMIHPGSGGRHKCWPIDQFLALADALAGNGAEIAWMLGPAEREKAAACCSEVVRRATQQHEEVVQTDDFAAAADRIGTADLYIGNDGGMTHVAAAMGVPTLAIYVATDPRVWRPLGNNVTTIDGRDDAAGVCDVLTIVRNSFAVSTAR